MVTNQIQQLSQVYDFKRVFGDELTNRKFDKGKNSHERLNF